MGRSALDVRDCTNSWAMATARIESPGWIRLRSRIGSDRHPGMGRMPRRNSHGGEAMGKLDGKVAVISGGGRGQGAVEARRFVEEGAKVVFGDVRDADGKAVEEAIRADGGDAVYVHLDVASEPDWRQAVETATQRYGKL